MDIQDDTYQTTVSFRGCWRWPGGCCLLMLLLLAGLCSLLFWLFGPDEVGAAQPAPAQPLAVWLLIDNSNSMFEMGGVGSDPELLRLDAARLFLTYLGVDEPGIVHQAGVIFFGSTAVTTVPLTPLTNDSQRTQLFTLIADPPRMGWTDHLAGLELAQIQLSDIKPEQHPVIILLTDGKPEWDQTPTETAQANYIAALQAKSAELAEAGISLSIILLANEVTDADADIATLWRPLWQTMSAATPSGRFYVARTAVELPNIYHDIVVTLTGRQTAGMVLDTAVTEPTEASLNVPSGLSQMTLVISKSSPTQTITIQTSDQVALADGQPHVRQAGGNDREEVWVIEQPPAGTWTLRLDGPGHMTIWQDYQLAPTPTAAPSLIVTTSPVIKAFPAPQLTTTVTNAPTATTTKPVLIIPTSLDKSGEDTVIAASTSPHWPWLLGGLLILGAASTILYLSQHTNYPTVTGTLRLLGDVQTEEGHTLIDLDSLQKASFMIGKAPSDMLLPGATGQAIIHPGSAVATGTHEMLIRGKGDLQLNGRPLIGETTLFDTAIISFGGGVEVRYENLRLRRAKREMEEIRYET